jgi:hypothetical protein
MRDKSHPRVAKSRGLVGIVRAGGRTLQDRECKDITQFARFRAANRHYPQLLDVLRAVSFHRPAAREAIFAARIALGIHQAARCPLSVFCMAYP